MAAFAQGLQTNLHEQLWSVPIQWQTKPPAELATVARHCSVGQEREKTLGKTEFIAVPIQHFAPGNTKMLLTTHIIIANNKDTGSESILTDLTVSPPVWHDEP